LGDYGNLPLFFSFFFFLFFFADDHLSFLKLSLRHGYRDMMHIKQARERLGWTVWAGQGENRERVFLFWVWASCLVGFGFLCFFFHSFDSKAGVSESSVTYDQLSFLDHFLKDSVRACVRFLTECLRSFVILQNRLFVDEIGCEIAGTCESELIGEEFWTSGSLLSILLLLLLLLCRQSRQG
jgi:hypothetical protein